MRLVKNIPLDTTIIESLISDPDDLHLVWPNANYPFDRQQWKEILNPEQGNIPFLVYDDSELIGHASIGKTEEDYTFNLNLLFVSPTKRSLGLGEKMIDLLEQYARERLFAQKLCLVVRSYNPRAHKCYTKCGFQEIDREDTLIKMQKILPRI